MNILSISRHAGHFLGLIAATAISLPIAASAFTLYSSDNVTQSILKISDTGVITPFVTGLTNTYGIAVDNTSGNLFVSDIIARTIKKISPSGVVTPFATGVVSYGLAIAPDPVPTAVPEPFTTIGTLLGGAAAFRMRKKFKATKNCR
jgi:hypothetical protein